jgi:uncharacterized protein YndB with AHSA1/START domain
VRLAAYEVTIAAPVEVVWAHLTTAEGLVRWVGPKAIQQGWAFFLDTLRDTLAAG